MEKRNKSIHFPKTYEDFVKSNFLCSDRQLEITVLLITKYLGSTMKVVNFSNRLTLKKLKVVLLLQIGNFLKLLWFVWGCQTAIQKLKISKFLDPFPKLKWSPTLSSLSLYVWHSSIKSVSINKLGSMYNFSFLWVCIVICNFCSAKCKLLHRQLRTYISYFIIDHIWPPMLIEIKIRQV